MTSDLVVVFVIGLFGSLHCVGMCGGFVLAVSQMHGRAARLQVHQALYFTGKALSYTLLGAVAGGLGAAVGHALVGVQNLLSIVLGAVLVLLGLGLVGVLGRIGTAGRLAHWVGLPAAVGRLLQRRTHAATFGLGLLNGLLPCGLVYALLVKAAATGSLAGGALTMAVFGLSTVPALYLLAVTGYLMRPAWRARLNQVGGVLVILLGLLTIVRGTPAMDSVRGLLHGNPASHGHHEQVEPAPAPESAPAHGAHRPQG